MKKLTLKDQGTLCYTISALNKPKLFVNPGEIVSVETEDAFSGQIRKEGDLRDVSKVPYANPQSGPIYVAGAKPGDTLSVKIDKIEPLIGQGATRIVSFWYASKVETELVNKFLNVRDVPHGTKICKISNGVVQMDGFEIPFTPMIGTMSTADPVETYLAWFPGPHGGNMDIPELTEGATLYLPVKVEGALLHFGDAHATQGGGELSGAAVEMPSLTTLTPDVLKNRSSLNWPRLENNEDIYVISATETGRPFEDAVRVAFLELALWMEEDYGIERWRAFELLTMVSKVRVGNLWTVAVGVPKKYLIKK